MFIARNGTGDCCNYILCCTLAKSDGSLFLRKIIPVSIYTLHLEDIWSSGQQCSSTSQPLIYKAMNQAYECLGKSLAKKSRIPDKNSP